MIPSQYSIFWCFKVMNNLNGGRIKFMIFDWFNRKIPRLHARTRHWRTETRIALRKPCNSAMVICPQNGRVPVR